MKHFWDMQTTKDKIIHILYPAYKYRYYEEAILECTKEYGELETKDAIKQFEEEFIKCITVEVERCLQD